MSTSVWCWGGPVTERCLPTPAVSLPLFPSHSPNSIGRLFCLLEMCILFLFPKGKNSTLLDLNSAQFFSVSLTSHHPQLCSLQASHRLPRQLTWLTCSCARMTLHEYALSHVCAWARYVQEKQMEGRALTCPRYAFAELRRTR